MLFRSEGLHPELAQAVQDSGRCGWFYRVLKPGFVSAELPFELVQRSYPSLSVARALQHFYHSPMERAGLQQLQGWIDSEQRRQLIAEIEPLLRAGDQLEIAQGKEFWFMPESAQTPPPRWKQACVTFLVILPLSLLVPWFWQPLFHLVPWLGAYLPSNVVITLSIVLLVVYLFMPMATRLFAAWLSPTADEDRP